MSRFVPRDVTVPSRAAILTGRQVSGQDWSQLGVASNWVRGRGRVMIPAHSPYMSAVVPSVAETGALKPISLRYYYIPTYSCSVERWGFGLGYGVTSAVAFVTIDGIDTFSVPVDDSVGGGSYDPEPGYVYLTRPSSTITPFDRNVVFTFSATFTDGLVIIRHVSCEENPASFLTATGNGVDPDQLSVGRPGMRSSFDNVIASSQDEYTAMRMLWAEAVPYAVDGTTDTTFAFDSVSATFEGIWDDAVPVLGMLRRYADTKCTANGKIYWWASDGTTAGEMRLLSDVHGAGTAVTLGAGTTSPTWSDTATTEIDADDVTAASGLQSSTWDGIMVQVRRTSGSGTIYVASSSGWCSA